MTRELGKKRPRKPAPPDLAKSGVLLLEEFQNDRASALIHFVVGTTTLTNNRTTMETLCGKQGLILTELQGVRGFCRQCGERL